MARGPVTDLIVDDAAGEAVPLNRWAGQVLVIVNTASKCGFTPQYAGFETLYRRFADRGFAVLGFPCNQFGGQEPGSADEIATFCSTRYNVTFPVFAKVEVNGAGAAAVFEQIKDEARGLLGSRAIKWNFTKFLVDRTGHAVCRYGPAAKPEDLAADIERLL